MTDSKPDPQELARIRPLLPPERESRREGTPNIGGSSACRTGGGGALLSVEAAADVLPRATREAHRVLERLALAALREARALYDTSFHVFRYLLLSLLTSNAPPEARGRA